MKATTNNSDKKIHPKSFEGCTTDWRRLTRIVNNEDQGSEFESLHWSNQLVIAIRMNYQSVKPQKLTEGNVFHTMNQ